MDCIAFPEVREIDGKIQEIRFPSALFQGELDLSGAGSGVLEFSDNLLFRGRFSDFKPASGLAILEHQGAVMCCADGRANEHTSYVMQYGHQHYWRSGDFLVALTPGARFAGNISYGQANGFGLLFSGPADSVESAYFGDFQSGLFHGRGIYLKVSGSNLARFNRFEGYFVGGERNGGGCLCLGGGDCLIGEFLQNQKVGVFLYIGACGEIEFRDYQSDICRRSYKSQRYYISNPAELRYMQLQSIDFDQAVTYFKSLEQNNLPCQSARSMREEAVPEVDTIWRYCKMATVPAITGLIDDYRVCNFIVSEGIAELAREASGVDCCGNTAEPGADDRAAPLFKQIEEIKSCLIGNYEVFRFLFNFYKARDLLVEGERVKAEYKNPLEAAIEQTRGELLRQTKARHAEQKKMVEKPEFETPEVRTESELEGRNNASQQMNYSADMTDDEPIRLADQKVQADMTGELGGDHSDSNSEMSDSLEKEYYKTLSELGEALAVMPHGNSARDNELLETFFGMLDANMAVSVSSIKQFVFDLAAHFEVYFEIFPEERIVDSLLQEFAVQADSYQIILQYDIESLLNSSSYILDFNGFALFTLELYNLFGYDTPAQFVEEIVFVYAKATAAQIIAVLDQDQMALSALFDPEDAFFKHMQAVKVRETTPNRRGREDPDNMSVAQSQISKMMSSISKKGKERFKASNVPKILLRDASNMLTDTEQAFFRCKNLPEKLQQLIELSIKYEEAFIFRPLINEKAEQLINEEFGITIMQYLDITEVNLEDFMFIFFDKFNEIFNFPRISIDAGFYFMLLAPFFIRFEQEKCDLFMPDAEVDKCQYLITHLSCFWMNEPVLTAVLACCLLKVEFNAEQKENGDDQKEEHGEEIEEPNSDLLSSNSFTSMAETAMSGQSSQSEGMSFREMEQLKVSMFDRKWDTFYEDMAVEMVGQVLKGIVDLWRRDTK